SWAGGAAVNVLAFARAGKPMPTVQGNEQQTIALWDLATMTRQRELSGVSHVSALAFSPDGRLLAAQGVVPDEGETSAIKPAIVVWDATTGEQRHMLDFPRNDQFLPLAFSPDGKSLASMGYAGSVTFWALGPGKPRKPVELAGAVPKATVAGKLAFAPDVKTIAGTAERTVLVWDLATGKQKCSLPDPSQQVACLTFSP